MCTPCSFAGSSFSMLFELDTFPGEGPTHAFSHVLGLMESASHALALGFQQQRRQGFRVSQNSGPQKLLGNDEFEQETKWTYSKFVGTKSSKSIALSD